MDQQIFAPKPENPNGPWDALVIGSGPAGLTAAIYTTRGAASTLILGGEVWGGQLMLTTNVDNYPALPGVLGPELMGKMREHSTMFGAEFIQKNVEAVDFSKKPFEVTAGGQKYTADSVIISTGAETLWLDVPGQKELIGRITTVKRGTVYANRNGRAPKSCIGQFCFLIRKNSIGKVPEGIVSG